jgi:hypothetical protein
MNMRRRVRAAIVVVLVMGAGLGIVNGKASAMPRKCATLNHNVEEELHWANYYSLLANGYLSQGDYEAASSATDIENTFLDLVEAGQALQAKLGC